VRSYPARLAGVVAVMAALLLALAPVQPSRPAAAADLPAPVTVDDHLHDGSFVYDSGTYYHYGTIYANAAGCAFRWGDATSHFCGFGVSTAPSLAGPWSAPVLLFDPASTDPWTGKTWDASCIGTTGSGCFNPRMIKRTSDGVWILWFNAVPDYTLYHANAYNVMGCNSPVGPCGPAAGAPNGSYNKPRIYYHGASNGDFSILTSGASAWIEYTGTDRAEYVEPLDSAWANGVGSNGNGTGPLFANVEGAGAWQDPATGRWVSTLSYPECGYCGGVNTIYMTSPAPLGPWTSPPNVEAISGPSTGDQYSRATLSAFSCGGQPRTIVLLPPTPDAAPIPWQEIDLWTGVPGSPDVGRNQANARTYLVPLTYDPSLGRGSAGDGQPFHPPFADWTCT
jgi:hypothetical protein